MTNKAISSVPIPPKHHICFNCQDIGDEEFLFFFDESFYCHSCHIMEYGAENDGNYTQYVLSNYFTLKDRLDAAAGI